MASGVAAEQGGQVAPANSDFFICFPLLRHSYSSTSVSGSLASGVAAEQGGQVAPANSDFFICFPLLRHSYS
ncbi:hypothetical protein C0U44_32010, partial [Klebsiella pneumoniae]